MITLDTVTYRYPQTRTPALDDVSLHIPQGQFCAVVGANGAGKSTLCYAISGFIPHFYKGTLAGTLTVAGHETAETPLAELAGHVGLVFSNPFNQITGARFTVLEEVAYGLENLGVPRAEMRERAHAALRLTGLDGLDDRSPYALSGGQQQRLAIASVVVMQPQLLVLDEPTSQLDPAGTRDIFALLDRLASSGETTVVLASHKLEWVGTHADRVIVLDAGRVLLDDEPRAVLGSPVSAETAGSTRYTQAARVAQKRGLLPPDTTLPVTLRQAITVFAPGAES